MRHLTVALILLGPGSGAFAQVPEVLLEEETPFNGALPGEVTKAIINVEVTEDGAYAVSGRSTDGVTQEALIFGSFSGGDPVVLRRAQTLGNYQQTSLGIQVGIGNGTLAYDCLVDDLVGGGTGLHAVFHDDTPLAVRGEVIPSMPSAVWSSRINGLVHMTDTGVPYWRQSFVDVFLDYAVFEGAAATPLLVGDSNLPGFVGAVAHQVVALNQFWQSSAGTHSAGILNLTGIRDEGIVLNGSAAPMGNRVMEVLEEVPLAHGGRSGEVWGGFTGAAVNESGMLVVNGYAVASTVHRLQVIDGQVRGREGDSRDGVVLGRGTGFVRLNDDGDRVYYWQLDNADRSGALFLNDDLLLQVGDPVDLDRDGFSDADATVRKIDSLAKFDLTGRSSEDTVDVYAAVQLDVGGERIDSLLRIHRNVGDLRLVARPSLAQVGDSVTLRVRGGLPGSPMSWVVISVNGIPRWDRLAPQTLDASGAAELVGTVPNGLGNLDIVLVALGVAPNGAVGLSNPTPLSLR